MSAEPIAIAPRTAAAKLQAEHVRMTFTRDGKSTPVLDDITLDVSEGEFVCLVGPSGCGKSTLLNIIAGFISPTGGTVRIDGEAVRGPDPRRIFVFQERGVFPWLTVRGEYRFRVVKLPNAERDHRIAHYIKMVGL